jgi:hypothetical protein
MTPKDFIEKFEQEYPYIYLESDAEALAEEFLAKPYVADLSEAKQLDLFRDKVLAGGHHDEVVE